ncbi:MAG: response regulator, partial [Desulfuromonadales bacterium]|nr:response regulator [Desulfuromonadales bacterium]
MKTEDDAKQILVVDDDPSIRRFLTESLRLRGYTVHSFDAAESALQSIDNFHFDLALLDILLPGANGLQLCRELRALPALENVPIIMMTAFYRQADHITQARESYGATDYLLKPFPLKILHEKIEALIGAPTQEASSERLSIEGNLNEMDFAQVLHNLYTLRTTGLLHLEHAEVKKVIYIRNGYPIFARSNLVREFLGQMLVRDNALTEEQLKQSLEISQQQNRRHGMVLIEMGLLTPHRLDEILRGQVTEKLLDIFSWAEGSYRFIQAREFKQGVTSIDLSPANLILQGLREYADREQLLKILEPHLDHYLEQAENPIYRFQEIQLSKSERRIVESCCGQTTLRELLQQYQLSRNTAEPLLAALLRTGILVGSKELAPADETQGCEISPETRNKREAFLKDYTWMMQQDYFTLLGVTDSDSREQVRNSYYNMVKKFHPDRFFEDRELSDLKEKVNDLFQRISLAHETLIDPKARAEYASCKRGTNAEKTKSSVESILDAKVAFQKGERQLQDKKYGDAAASFAEALRLNPSDAEHLMYHAWSCYKADTSTAKSAIEVSKELNRALALNPKLGQA